MDPAIAALVAATAAAAAIYVFHRGSSKPTPAGELPPGTYLFGKLHADVVAAVEASGFFTAKYGKEQLAAGDLYVTEEPTGEKEGEPPELPGGRPLRPKPPVPIQIDGTKAILLDIRECLPAAAGGGGAAGQIEALTNSVSALTIEVHQHLQQTAMKKGHFSGISWTDAVGFFSAIGLQQGGRLPVPPLGGSSAVLDSLRAYPWAERESETDASPSLRPLLQRWTSNRSSPRISPVFYNVEPLTQAPLVAEAEGYARYTGVPDMVTLQLGLGEVTVSPFTNCSSSWDWKHPVRFLDRAKVAAQAVLQLVAFSRLPSCTDNCTHPVFFTDMATGVRCWIMIAGVIYNFHDDKKDLSLEQGVRLLRYFIYNRGRLSPADKASLLPSAAGSGGGSGSGSGGQGSAGAGGPAGPSTPGPKPSGGSGSSGKGASPYLEAVLKGHPAAGGGRRAAGGTLQSQQSSPGDPNWTAADDVAAFQMELAGAALTLQACGVDLEGVYDPSV